MRRRTLALAGFLVALPWLSSPLEAAAGPYVVDSCPSMPYPYEAGWTRHWFKVPADSAYESCDSLGEFGVDLAGVPQSDGASSSWTIEAPEGTQISTVRWMRRVTATEPYVYELTGSQQQVFESSNPSRGVEAALPTGVWEQKQLDVHTSSLTIRVRCETAGATCEERVDNGVGVRAAKVELMDFAAPSVSASLYSNDSSERPESWRFIAFAEDRGAGIQTMMVMLDGKLVANGTPPAGLTCGSGPFMIRPCPPVSLAQIDIPRSTVLAGKANLWVIVYDASGAQSQWGPVPISTLLHLEQDVTVPPTQSPAATQPAAPNLDRLLSISATLSSHNTGRPGAFSKPPAVRGVVRDDHGAPVAGARLELSGRPLMGGSAFALIRTLTTDAKGEFSTRLPAGPSRELKLTIARPGGWSVATLQTVVKAPISVKTDRSRARNGETVRFGGRIVGAPSEARTRVELQAWAGRWVPFAMATVSRGRFTAKYTFKRTYRATTYRFRAVLPSDPNFPYAAATSKQVRVRVAP